ncbi:MAG: DUF3343 domain-containing protein [Niameybacter sp.]|uniref:DUF3343 domain-containing protein n=1 Tax=Niameybacter sp. TaxID=2033640 RepID=UPI002FCBFF15
MRKTLKLIVAFPTTTYALKAEYLCKEQKIPGRLIPIPRQISAGCGFAWCTDIEHKDCMHTVLSQAQITTDGIYEMLL